ncbi:nucleotidyltransferase [Sphingobacterium multivorum]|uniref:nucleotidyltransferase n=1 Tax=Sphingobacterium multivorum TaxID=28454 RepID=UPI0028A605EC|nr:nucleotidyltransferase [Sphingobacterium multivorum]
MKNIYIPNTFNQQLDDLLNRIAEKLQLDDTRRSSAERSYNAVSEWIEADIGFFKNVLFNIYPQGSYRIGTNVKPLNGEEFDLDIVIHMMLPYESFDPIEVLNELERRLKEHGQYKTMIQRKNRCIRIIYANLFHIDILPAFQESDLDPNKIVVPDRLLRDWTPSNPKGYATWFESRYVTRNQLLLEKALRAEDLPEQIPYQLLQPIQRAVQLIKRFRDIYFKENPDDSTSSIILTTVAGMFYNGEASEYEAIKGIINRTYNALALCDGIMDIVNPANTEEKFSDKWINEPNLYKCFKKFISDFKNLRDKIDNSKGISGILDILKEMFGENTSTNSLIEQSEYITKARNAQQLGVNRTNGLITKVSPAATLVEKNNFYGE